MNAIIDASEALLPRDSGQMTMTHDQLVVNLILSALFLVFVVIGVYFGGDDQ